ncbi:porin family protein [unidentified bacterial endosymbiont]|uniref:porin family protein n=1 Tax=unidentified bacterial endosymbiont TaxID=2355 RepID=UPI00209EBD05|nr:porin family protein [unidentified bacterial endosymbiont]
MKKQLCAVALITTAALGANVQADDFTYLSVGLSLDKSGFLSDTNKTIDNHKLPTDKQKEGLKAKDSGAGFYLNGSVGFENNFFAEGRIQNSKAFSNYLLGVGYHYPLGQKVDFYGLLGMSKRDFNVTPLKVLSNLHFFENLLATGKITEQQADASINALSLESPKELVSIYQDKIQPTVEIGVKARLNDLAGVQVAYRFSQFGKETIFTEKENLHEGRIVGYYKVTDTLALEAGYTYNSFSKGTFKDHRGQVGLRYIF